MNRLFGRGKPTEPPPNITDCIAGVSAVDIFAQYYVYCLLTASITCGNSVAFKPSLN